MYIMVYMYIHILPIIIVVRARFCVYKNQRQKKPRRLRNERKKSVTEKVP